MYTLAKAPSKFVVSARRGPPRTPDFESYDIRDKSSTKTRLSPPETSPEMSNPRPTFQQRRPINRKAAPATNNQSEPALTPNHEEMARLLLGQWRKVEEGLKKQGDEWKKVEEGLKKQGDEPKWEMYREKDCDRTLDDFQAFDLEKFWGNRTLKNALGKPS